METINPQKINKAYFIGIKGVGMSALAQVFLGLGVKVEGSDTEEEFFTDAILNKKGVQIHSGFSKKNISSEFDCCVVSNAYLNEENPNPEVQRVRDLELPLFSYGEALASLFNQAGLRLAVAGTHGKSTTTAMLGELLVRRFSLPTFCLVGTEVLNWESNAWIPGKTSKDADLSQFGFLVEADEYKEAFLNYSPHLLILTNIDFDHPDYFHDQDSYLEAFVRLMEKMKPSRYLDSSAPVVVARKDDSNIEKAVKRVDSPLEVFYFDLPEKEMDLPVSSRVYQLNAAAALKAAQILGAKEGWARKNLSQFGGTRRRLEKEEISVQDKKVLFIDDYAHHPKEITATLDYIFSRYSKGQVQIVFQPHTFSRSKAFLDDFVRALSRAENLVLVPTYGSAREEEGEIRAENIYKEIKKTSSCSRLHYADSLESASSFLKDNLEDTELVLTLGAGDVWKLKEKLKRG